MHYGYARVPHTGPELLLRRERECVLTTPSSSSPWLRSRSHTHTHTHTLPPASAAARCMPVQAQVKTVDMSEEMERDAIEFAMVALSEYSVEAQMAAHIKREFDKKYRCHPHVRLFCVRFPCHPPHI